ncbi:MAG: ACT domain-containing protein [Anaerolineae bacterium]|nr:ACT domain-containing protein [Anaerolineae bacterium]NUQ02569.1 ACT domain-containing protein [Anaerolineae bacterium]
MAQTVEGALRQAGFETDGVIYVMVRLTANGTTAAAGILAQIGEPFASLVADKHEVTLIIPQEVVEDFRPRFRDHQISETLYRLITLDVVLEPTLVGFMARLSTALASAKISILPYAAFSRDHLLVPADQFDLAMKTLRDLQSSL